MSALTVHHNEEPTAATIRDGLNLVFSTTLCPQRKDNNDAFYHDGRALQVALTLPPILVLARQSISTLMRTR